MSSLQDYLDFLSDKETAVTSFACFHQIKNIRKRSCRVPIQALCNHCISAGLLSSEQVFFPVHGIGLSTGYIPSLNDRAIRFNKIRSGYSAQNGSESRFRDKCLFLSVDLCYILWSVLLHHLTCIGPFL